ncbi:hypothetical protein [Cryptosporangium phraense]|uniref:Uncharacterized protein n=1 Tax=Cryptosporangium phraense TaxID=2593070 RepID=A0A545AZ45_9ACTN|nr:hypothetical protein [Cryptosporangium phraense]TQS46574.1 hypothetical protein FL583_04115 [Cryptosporangium phraense]
MNTTIRRTSVLLAGLTLAAGGVLGLANPASADNAKAATTQNQTARGAHGHNWNGWDDDDWDFRGLYNSRWACERAGQWQTRGWRGDDYVCVRSNQWRRGWDRRNTYGNWGGEWDRWGHRYGVWALYVED